MADENLEADYLAKLTLGASAQAIGAAQRKLRPSPLDLVFHHAISGCVHTGPVYVAGSNIRVKAEWFRVGVTNGSSAAVDTVGVQALGLKPDTVGILPAALHWNDDNPPPGGPYMQAKTIPAYAKALVTGRPSRRA